MTLLLLEQQMRKPARILLVDDHQIVLDGLANLLNTISGLLITGTVLNATQALDFLKTNETDLLITDVNMPGGGGVALCTEVRKRYPSVRVLMLTMLDDVKNIREAIRAGTMGYVLKRAGVEELTRAISVILSGRKYFSDEIIIELAATEGEDLNAVNGASKISFSKRELEVLKLVAQEYSTPQIAEKLGLTNPTIETFRQRMIKKAGVKGSIGLVLYAMKHELL